MIEFAAALVVVVCTGGAIGAGVTYGTRYIDGKLRYDADLASTENKPLVRPSHPSGLDWRIKS